MDVVGHAERIATEGYSILEDAIEPSLIDALVADISRLHDELAIDNVFEGDKTLRIYNLLARGKVFEQVPVHERVLPIIERVLDVGCLVSSLSSITILPGQTAQPMHVDDQLIPLPRPHVPLVCNTMWALTEFTLENGATRLVPRSHQNPEIPAPFDAHTNAITAVMKKGSVLVWNGSVWHQGGANTTDTPRIGLAMNYCAGWIRQQENQQLGIPRELAKTFSPRLRKLVGYGLYKRLLGHIDKCSPVDLLDETGPRPIVGKM